MELSAWLLAQATRRSVVHCVERLARRGALSQGPADRAQIALTFDDGPDPRFTPSVLEALAASGAKATFFVVGRAVDEHPELVLEAHRRGHEIGTHLYSHDRAVVFDERRFDDELRRSKDQLESLLNAPLCWLRFPYGERGRQTPERIRARYGISAAHWTYSSHDSRLTRAEAIVERVRAALRPGVIVLLHDRLADGADVRPPYVADRSGTVAALPTILAELRARSLSAVTLSELTRASSN